MPELRVNDTHRLFIFSPTRFNTVDAGRGWGKTQCVLARIIRHMGRPYQDQVGTPLPHKIWYIAPTLKQGKMIFWQRLKSFFDGFIAEKNEQETRLVLKNGAEIRIVGSEQYDNLRGPYLTYAIFDEFAFHKPDYWHRVIRPMLGRVSPLGQADFLSTPDGHNEFYELFNLGNDPTHKDWASFHFKTVEGGFIPDEEVTAAKANMTLDEWRQEYEGEFIAQAGRVYHQFDRLKHCRATQHVPGLPIFMAWDFNSTPSCHLILAHIHPLTDGKPTKDSKLYIFDEIAIGHTDAIMDEFIKRYPIGRVIDDKGNRPPIHVYGDCSGNNGTTGITDYQTVENALSIKGYGNAYIHVTTRNPLVKDRVNSVNTKMFNALDEVGLYINHETCPKVVRDFEMVKWTEMGKIDKTTDTKLTHASDAIGYLVWEVWPIPSLATRIRYNVKPGGVTPNGYWTEART